MTICETRKQAAAKAAQVLGGGIALVVAVFWLVTRLSPPFVWAQAAKPVLWWPDYSGIILYVIVAVFVVPTCVAVAAILRRWRAPAISGAVVMALFLPMPTANLWAGFGVLPDRVLRRCWTGCRIEGRLSEVAYIETRCLQYSEGRRSLRRQILTIDYVLVFNDGRWFMLDHPERERSGGRIDGWLKRVERVDRLPALAQVERRFMPSAHDGSWACIQAINQFPAEKRARAHRLLRVKPEQLRPPPARIPAAHRFTNAD